MVLHGFKWWHLARRHEKFKTIIMKIFNTIQLKRISRRQLIRQIQQVIQRNKPFTIARSYGDSHWFACEDYKNLYYCYDERLLLLPI